MKASALTKTPVIIILAIICCFLWGSAFPSIKIGYRLFQIASDDTAGQLLFAGCRFFLAGLLVTAFGSVMNRKLQVPKRTALLPIAALASCQTIGQYFFFYIALAHTTGVKSSIITAASTFFTILFAALLFRYEKLTPAKIAGCLVGFAGVVIINLAGGGLDLHLAFNGEGFALISTIASALASPLIKHFSQKESPMLLCGYQFMLGGLVLAVCGFCMGGRLHPTTGLAFLLLLYMACISAVAYTVWSILLKYNPVSRIAVFSFVNPVFGVILSAALLGEQNQAFSLYGLLALLLVSAGIVIVYRTGAPKESG